MGAPVVSHVADTARWVAVYRAMESERLDALFHDPYARRLAGERGEAILRAMPHGRRLAWPMVVRTAVMDEIIVRLIGAAEVDAVVNLAAGLDARPWRLALPDRLEWVDVDHPDMIRYKTDAMRGETPHCAYRSVGLDLADTAGRRALLESLAAEHQRILVVSEGLLVYLPEAAVRALGNDLHQSGSFRYWLTDLASPALLAMLGKSWGPVVAAGNAPFQFAPANSVAFFGALGWRETEYRAMFYEGLRLGRSFPMARFWALLTRLGGRKRVTAMERFSGIALYQRH